MSPKIEKAGLIKWQQPMTRVLIAVAPLAAAGVYWFGWRVLALLALVNTLAFLSEYAFTRGWKEPVTSAVFVTGTLFTLSLPPNLPFWMAGVGIIFAVVFGKMVFGGFGRNAFNPAMTGRAFIYICFGHHMTGMWPDPVGGALGGLARWSSDAITSATPGMLLKQGESFALLDLFLGNSSGTIGGTSAVLAIVGGLYLLWTKAANYRIVVAGFVGFLLTHTALWLAGVDKVADPLHAILAGSFVVGMFFYATDPVSASQVNEGRWIYGAFIGIMSSLISSFSMWPAGTMFAILLANMFAPIMDHYLRQAGFGKPPPRAGAVKAPAAPKAATVPEAAP